MLGPRHLYLQIQFQISANNSPFSILTLAGLFHRGTSQGPLAYFPSLRCVAVGGGRQSKVLEEDKMQPRHLCYLVILWAENSSLLLWCTLSKVEEIFHAQMHTGVREKIVQTLKESAPSREKDENLKNAAAVSIPLVRSQLRKMSQTRIHPTQSRVSRILPYHSVLLLYGKSHVFAKCRLYRTKEEGLNCLQSCALFMRRTVFCKFQKHKDVWNIWWSLGLLCL